MSNPIKIGTRGSKLALWQANYVADKLKEGGLDTEIITIQTKGDKILNKTIAKIGNKGVFTEELEEKLKELRKAFNLDEDDLNISLGPLQDID